VIERLVVTLIVASVALWLVFWLLAHLGLLFIGAVGFVGWAWWRARRRA
jgi:Flp pilus assembly protein TadB